MKTIACLGTARETQCIGEALGPAGLRMRRVDGSDLDAIDSAPLDAADPSAAMQQRALLKARLAARRTGLRFGVSVAGYMGVDPHLRMLPWAFETIAWWDSGRSYAVFESAGSSRPLGARQLVWNWAGARAAAERAGFPRQALVVGSPGDAAYCRGIVDPEQLHSALEQAWRDGDGAWLSVDPRTEFNPGRAELIGRVAVALAYRLAVRCGTCGAAGMSEIQGAQTAGQRLCHHCGAMESPIPPLRTAGDGTSPQGARRVSLRATPRIPADAQLGVVGSSRETARQAPEA